MRLIDADEFEVVTTGIPDGMDAESYMAGMDFVLNKIDDAPTIEERKKGEWVTRWHKTFKCHLPVCNCCNRYEPFKTDYCPNCGADMRGDNHETY